MDEEGGVNTSDLVAETIAAISDSDLAPQEPNAYPEPVDQTPAEEVSFEGVEEELYEEAVPAEAEPVPQEPEVAEVDFDELSISLAEAGIDIGIDRANLPPEVFEAVAQELLRQNQSIAAERQQLEQSQYELQQFANKLQEDPTKVLLTMALTNPEAFQQTVTTFEDMQADPRTKDLVMRELQADATLASAKRQQDLYQKRALTEETLKFTQATHRAAVKYNVDSGLAERMVALQIQANAGTMELGAVDGVVSGLRPMGPKNPVVATPAKMAAAATAPAPVQGVAEPATSAPPAEESSPGLEKVASANPFLNLVRSASNRIGRISE